MGGLHRVGQEAMVALRVRDLGCLTVCLALVLGACGGGDTDTGEAETPSTAVADTTAEVSLDAEATDAATTIVDRLGPAEALDAVLLALDAGYGPDQIMDGGAVLEADGMIPGVEPDGPVQGVFADGPVAVGGLRGVWAASLGPVLIAVADEEAPTVQSIADELERDFDLGGRIVGGTEETLSETERENTAAMVGALLILIDTGYSLEQIIEGVVFGEYRWALGSTSGADERSAQCIVLASSDGTLVTPANRAPESALPSGGICAAAISKGTVKVLIDGRRVDGVTTTTTAATVTTSTSTSTTTTSIPPALAFPRTYVGGGTARWSFSFPPPGSCVVEDTLELTLEDDGTLHGLYTRTSPTFVGKPGDAPTTLECGEQIFVDELEVTGSHTPPGAGSSEAGTIDVEIVGWPDWHMGGAYTPDTAEFEWEIQYEAAGYEGDEPHPRVINFVDFELLFADQG